MKLHFFVSAFLSFGISLPTAAEQTRDEEEGRVLFEKHGCTNCHGEGGTHPTSRYVPILKGKPADYIYQNAIPILGGKQKSEKTRFMHDQFCIDQVQEVGCYPPPSAVNLRVIAEWLAGKGVISKKKTTPQGLYVTFVEAYVQLQKLGDKALFIDIRTRAEVAFIGMPAAADANIPYMTTGSFDEWDEKKKTFKLHPNGEFVKRIKELVEVRGLREDSPIFLVCRSGSRSAKAANVLNLAGYTKVYTVTDGFEGDKAKDGPRKGERVVNGWKNSGLPWSYELDTNAMYWDL